MWKSFVMRMRMPPPLKPDLFLCQRRGRSKQGQAFEAASAVRMQRFCPLGCAAQDFGQEAGGFIGSRGQLVAVFARVEPRPCTGGHRGGVQHADLGPCVRAFGLPTTG